MIEIPRKVLSDEIERIVAGRRLRSAVFLTFRFDPGFFEIDVLPPLLNVPLSHVPAVRLLSVADALREVDSIGVYYDRQGLMAGSASAKLDIERVGLSHPTGYFHPKNLLLIVEGPSPGASRHPFPEAGEGSEKSLIVASLSANLTRAGWWENVEVAHVEEVAEGASCSFREDVLQLIRRLRAAAPRETRHEALNAIHAFVLKLQPEAQRMRAGVILPRLFTGDSLVEFLNDVAGNRLQRCNLEILSPYFDDAASDVGPIEQFVRAFRPSEIRVFLPRGLTSEALCTPGYYEAVSKSAQWGALPKDLMRMSKSTDRTLHAKVYRFFDRDRAFEAFFIGSANLTRAAFNPGGNFESGFYVETEAPTRKQLDWWLTKDEQKPAEFASRDEDEGVAEGSGWKLALRYDWQSDSTRAFWDDSKPSPPITLLAHGVQFGTIGVAPPRQWIDLSAEISKALAGALKSSSFVTVRIDGEPDVQILVDEERMTHKPSLMSTLTADEILRYWSLLTAEQKKEFLEEHAQELVNDPEAPMWGALGRHHEARDSFFSTFAEIYLSFGNLERTIRNALAAKREREAIDRLFGQKFDSLRRLVERVLQEQKPDTVRSYVTLLCARQLLDTIEHDEPDFIARHRSDVKLLRDLIARVAEVRNRFTFAEAGEREAFLAWFDEWFVTKAHPLETAAK